MQQLSVIGVEDGVLILETDSGERFSVPVDALPERRKQPSAIPHRERKASPRDIQSLIRGGMTAEQVASSTGEELAYIERFEGPVLAERAHVLDSALSIPVASGDIDPLAQETTFGAAIEERLDDLRASDRSWSSWKDADGGAWTVRLRFTTEGIQHEALWGYEAKKATLTPRGKEAISLSQSSDASSVLVPRLRAIDRQSRPAAPVSAEEPAAASAARARRRAGRSPDLAASRDDRRRPLRLGCVPHPARRVAVGARAGRAGRRARGGGLLLGGRRELGRRAPRADEGRQPVAAPPRRRGRQPARERAGRRDQPTRRIHAAEPHGRAARRPPSPAQRARGRAAHRRERADAVRGRVAGAAAAAARRRAGGAAPAARLRDRPGRAAASAALARRCRAGTRSSSALAPTTDAAQAQDHRRGRAHDVCSPSLACRGPSRHT